MFLVALFNVFMTLLFASKNPAATVNGTAWSSHSFFTRSVIFGR